MPPKVRKQFLKPAASRVNAAHRGAPPVVAEINALLQNWKQRLGLWPKPKAGQVFSLASDCSGYGSELLALRLLGLQKKAQLIMTCESCSKKRALHDVMVKICGFDPSREDFQDIFRRDNASAPRADLYIAGYPCPSFSRMGKRAGTKDVRGMVTLQGLLYIATKRPRTLVLEQVAALMQDKQHRQVWTFLQKVLTALDYTFAYDIVNTRHMGIPQSRPRLYLFAVCRESVTGPLPMPTAREHHPDLHTFINKSLVGNEKLQLPTYEQKLGKALWQQGWILDVAASPRYQHAVRNCSPCLFKTRCKQGGYYVPELLRRLTCQEICSLQGVPEQVVTALLEGAKSLPSRTVEESAGDGMSINVLFLVLRRCLDAAGLTSLGSQRDYWLRCPADKLWQLSDSLWKMHA